MSFIFQIILTIILNYFLQLILPWWSIAISSFLIPLFINVKGFKAFLGGFTSISCLWMIYAAIIDVQTNYIISTKVAPIFGFKSSIALVLISGLLGGLIAGFFALSAYFIKSIITEALKSKSKFGYMSE